MLGPYIQVQQNQPDVPIWKSEEGAEAVWGGSKGTYEDRSNYVGVGGDVQGGGPYRATLWDPELGGDRGDAEGSGEAQPSGGPEDSRGVILMIWGGGVGVFIGGAGLGGGGDVSCEEVHFGVVCYHCGVNC